MTSDKSLQAIFKRHERLIKAEKRIRAWQRVLNGFFILYVVGLLGYFFSISVGIAPSSKLEACLNEIFEHAFIVFIVAASISRALYCRVQHIESIKYFRRQANKGKDHQGGH